MNHQKINHGEHRDTQRKKTPCLLWRKKLKTEKKYECYDRK